MGAILVFDTETISLEKKFIYNLGYVIADADGKIICERDFVIRQIYDNKPLFATSYYVVKRPLYTRRLQGRKCQKVSWGEACRIMCKDIQTHGVTDGYAYNSPFDISAFYFNHLFFRNKRRPLDGIKVHDIMKEIEGLVNTEEYRNYCRVHGFMTRNGRTRQTAEVVYGYITQNPNYIEEHTALADSRIELAILRAATRATEIGKVAKVATESAALEKALGRLDGIVVDNK